MSTQWYTLRRGGIALVASGALLLILIAWSLSLSATASAPVLYVLLNIVAYVLLLFGLPAIYVLESGSGRAGQIGFACIAISAVISILALILAIFNITSIPGVLDWIYLITSTFGYIVVGWITARPNPRFFSRPPSSDEVPAEAPPARIFPTWVGWTMLAAGAVSLLLGPGYGDILLLFAIAGFGISIIRMTQPTVAGPTDEAPLDKPSVEPQA